MWCSTSGFLADGDVILQVYIIPYLVVNNWLVTITLLQHTHPKLAHYNDKEWDWLRGALATVDRSYGFLDYFFHHIADTHVAHHLFSNMPHYHAEEARACSSTDAQTCLSRNQISAVQLEPLCS